MGAHSGLGAIEVFRPWDCAETRRLRARILNCQSIATTRIKTTDSDHARTLYWVALDMASQTAFRSCADEHLVDVINALARLFLVAGQIERWES